MEHETLTVNLPNDKKYYMNDGEPFSLDETFYLPLYNIYVKVVEINHNGSECWVEFL